ncbi:Uncharacterized protein PCOAH_00004050 [Plasmodium coatneyi]|uniref:Uncharacterized protein n=1 Tax=Plasmodium coatneyi TaxID=208452 RepID=A0A1B1DUK9_9APIC|nr:Uncharacterized protein PCOAH_00004050 [Plasmodium coatneyi]ANQ06297.1 Uncharacterized protein PCOAH_00004050 [Plasmodium coatneyi]
MDSSNKSNSRNMKANVLSVLFRVIAVTLVFWQSRAPQDMKNPAEYSNRGKNVYAAKSVGRLERILRSNNSNIFQEYAGLQGEVHTDMMDSMTNVSGLSSPLSVQVIQEQQEQYQEQLDELIHKITNTWNDTFINMVEDYIDFTERNNIIDGEWKCQMWNQRWYRYLQFLAGSLNEVIEDDNYPLETKEYISDEFLYWANHDFIWFLSIVKAEWDRRAEVPEQPASQA